MLLIKEIKIWIVKHFHSIKYTKLNLLGQHGINVLEEESDLTIKERADKLIIANELNDILK